MEAKLKKVFADVKAPVNPAERIYYPVADNKEPLVYIGTDKEVENPSVSIFFKQDATPDSLKNTIAYYATQYMLNMAINMLDNPANEIQPGPPILLSPMPWRGYGNYFLAKTKEAFTLSADSKINGIDLAMKTVLEEAERARPFRIYRNRIRTRTRQLHPKRRVCLQRTRKNQKRQLCQRIHRQLPRQRTDSRHRIRIHAREPDGSEHPRTGHQ